MSLMQRKAFQCPSMIAEGVNVTIPHMHYVPKWQIVKKCYDEQQTRERYVS